MRLLALSDIHDNLVALRRLRAQETNAFDAIVVAGDIGNAGAGAFFDILRSFACPVVYVYGNWDNELDYAASYGADCRLLHQNVVTIGGVHFTGFSGCPTKWGRNPIARKLDAAHDVALSPRVLALNRDALKRTVARERIDPDRTVVVTHERLARLDDVAPGALLHLYGHVHAFADRTRGASRHVNVSVLDRPVSAHPRGAPTRERAALRNFNAGNYVVIEIGRARGLAVRCVPLPHDYPGWVALDDVRHTGLDWIPEEHPWTCATDPRLPRFKVGLGAAGG